MRKNGLNFLVLIFGRWPAHQPGRTTKSIEKLCPVHRSFIAMSGHLTSRLRESDEVEQRAGRIVDAGLQHGEQPLHACWNQL